eukprot:Skav218587  [mRNA]  locus=scaffold2610:692635:696393:- [translate_table: standard]
MLPPGWYSARGQGSEEEGRAIRSRLRLRLGTTREWGGSTGALNDSLVSGQGLHDACAVGCVALGLTAYTVDDTNNLVNQLAEYIDLDFEREEGQERARRTSDMAALLPTPQPATHGGHQIQRDPDPTRIRPTQASMQQAFDVRGGPKKFNVVPAMPLMEVFLAKECEVHRTEWTERGLASRFEAQKYGSVENLVLHC